MIQKYTLPLVGAVATSSRRKDIKGSLIPPVFLSIPKSLKSLAFTTLNILIMKFSTSAAVAAVAAGVSASGNYTTITTDVAVTETNVVTSYTTYCPVATTFAENNVTYTVTEATVLTITNCPCTRTTTYTTSTTSVCPVESTTAGNTTVVPATSASKSTSIVEGGAAVAGVASGALAGLVAVAAYLL